jgi:transglutaminase-like putative cysteine protease
MNSIKQLTLGLGALFLGTLAFAQSVDEYRAKYPNANGVFLKKNESATITVDKLGNAIVDITHDQERLFLNENFKYYTEDEIGYSSFTEITNIEPAVYVPNGDKYKKVKIKDIQDEDAFDESVFHDDYKLKRFLYAGLQNGGKTSLQFEKRLTEPRFFGSFYFSSYLPIESASYSITTPADMEIAFTMFGSEEQKKKVKYSVTESKSNKVHTWSVKNMPENHYESGSVDMRYIMTHIQVRIKSYKFKGETKNILRDVNDLYTYYYDFVKDVNTSGNKELEAIADSITKGFETTEDKVREIYYWVQDHIRYVAFEDGMGGFIPRKAQLVCDRKYGDCKDMSSVLYTMINSIGIPAYYTWVGSRDIPYTYDEVPTPSVDNHMICTYFNGEDYVFLDGTGSGTIYGFPTSFIQGKQTLVGISPTEYKLLDVPILESSASQTVDTVHVEIDGTSVKGTAKVTYTGYASIYLSNAIQNMSEKEKDKFFKSAFKKGNKKSECDVLEMRGLDSREEALEIDYTFDTPDYVKEHQDELFFNPFLKKYHSGAKINLETTKNPIESTYREMNKSFVSLKIPEGYVVEYIPEPISYQTDKFSVDVSFKHVKESNRIEITTNFDLNYLVIEPEEFLSWNEMVKKLNGIYTELIIFKRK